MKMKVLVVPTTIVLAGFIAVHYIKPGFDEYTEKRAVLAIAKENASQAEAVANNVRSLNEQLGAKKESIDFIKRYFPENKDQGRMFDSLNFVTSQVGLLTSKIQMEEATDADDTASTQTFGVVEPISADPAVPLAGESTAVAPVSLYQPPKVQRYAVSLEAIGGYSNVKDLLQKLAVLDRLQEFDSFRIGVGAGETAASPEDAPASNGTLTVSYRSLLPYQAVPNPLGGEGIVNIPGLAEPNFDFSVTDSIKTNATIIPNVVLGTEGKGNPFE